MLDAELSFILGNRRLNRLYFGPRFVPIDKYVLDDGRVAHGKRSRPTVVPRYVGYARVRRLNRLRIKPAIVPTPKYTFDDGGITHGECSRPAVVQRDVGRYRIRRLNRL